MRIVNYYRGIPTDSALVSLMAAPRDIGNEVISCFPPGAGRPKGDAPALSNQHEEQLKALRYVWSTPSSSARPGGAGRGKGAGEVTLTQ